VELNL